MTGKNTLAGCDGPVQVKIRWVLKICFFNYKSGVYLSNIRLFAINHIFLFLYNYDRILTFINRFGGFLCKIIRLHALRRDL